MMSSTCAKLVPVSIAPQRTRVLIAVGDQDELYVVPGQFDHSHIDSGDATGIAPIELMDLLGESLCKRIMRGQITEDCGQPSGPMTTSVDKDRGDMILELLEERFATI